MPKATARLCLEISYTKLKLKRSRSLESLKIREISARTSGDFLTLPSATPLWRFGCSRRVLRFNTNYELRNGYNIIQVRFEIRSSSNGIKLSIIGFYTSTLRKPRVYNLYYNSQGW